MKQSPRKFADDLLVSRLPRFNVLIAPCATIKNLHSTRGKAYHQLSFWICIPMYGMHRKDQRHPCEGYNLSMIKRETGTYTDVERKEFESFQRSRGKYVRPFMKEVIPNMSNQRKGQKTGYFDRGPEV
jgi:hypothetical protein